MPSSSKKQHNFMAAIAHSPSFAKKVGISQSVGSDFVKADKGRKFAKGGDMATNKKLPAFMQKMMDAKDKANGDAKKSKGRPFAGGGCSKMAKGGVTRADGPIRQGHTKGKMV